MDWEFDINLASRLRTNSDLPGDVPHCEMAVVTTNKQLKKEARIMVDITLVKMNKQKKRGARSIIEVSNDKGELYGGSADRNSRSRSGSS